MVLWWVCPAQGCNAGVKYFFIRKMFLETIYEVAVRRRRDDPYTRTKRRRVVDCCVKQSKIELVTCTVCTHPIHSVLSC